MQAASVGKSHGQNRLTEALTLTVMSLFVYLCVFMCFH